MQHEEILGMVGAFQIDRVFELAPGGLIGRHNLRYRIGLDRERSITLSPDDLERIYALLQADTKTIRPGLVQSS